MPRQTTPKSLTFFIADRESGEIVKERVPAPPPGTFTDCPLAKSLANWLAYQAMVQHVQRTGDEWLLELAGEFHLAEFLSDRILIARGVQEPGTPRATDLVLTWSPDNPRLAYQVIKRIRDGWYD